MTQQVLVSHMSIYKKITLVIFCWFIFPFVSFAQSPAAILQSQLSSFHSMTADFKQVVTSANGVVLQKSSGTMEIMRPGKFRWNTLKPLRQLIVTDGKKVWIYEPDLQQVTIRPLDNSVGQTPALLLTSAHVFLEKNFNIETVKNKKSQFKLTPKDNNEMFNAITLSFKNNVLAQMKLENQLGQDTMLIFSNVKINPKLNAQSFSFKIPKDIDVIDQTDQGVKV